MNKAFNILVDKEKQIQEIMEEFDFQRVHKAMEALNWRYFAGGRGQVPPVEVLKSTAHRLLRNSLISAPIISERYTGGFWVKKTQKTLKLSFVVESWEGPCD